MPSVATKTSAFTFPELSSSNNSGAIEFDGVHTYPITLPAMDAQNVGTLTTRTDDNTGEATLAAGHNIISTDVVDVYWSGGVRYGMVATVTGNVVALEGGAGDNLPAQDTAITGVYEQIAVDPLNLDGDAAAFVAIIYRNPADQSGKSHINLQDSGNATIKEADLVHEAANGGHAHVYNISGGDTNVFTGNPITKAKVSHNSTSEATLYVACGFNATP